MTKTKEGLCGALVLNMQFMVLVAIALVFIDAALIFFATQ